MAKSPAETVYGKQNKSLHKAFSASGMPYNANKESWQPVLVEVAKRKVDGISSMTLGERYWLIKHFQEKGHSLHNPRIYKGLWHWKKGDKRIVETTAERPLEVAVAKLPLIKKIGAILAEHRKDWKYADGIAKNMKFKADAVEWLSYGELEKVMQALIIYNRRQGGPEV